MGQSNQKSPTRREFLQKVATLGSLAAASTLLEACSKTGLSTATAHPTATATATLTAEPTATATATPTAEPTATATPTATFAPVPEPTATATPTAAPTPTPVVVAEEEMTTVAFVKTTDRAEGVRRVIDLLGINPIEGKTVLLKPNFNSADPAPGSTHPDVLRSLVTRLQEMGARTITVGDRSGVGSTQRNLETLGVFELGEELGFEVINFDKLYEADDWVMIKPPDSHWKQGFPFARPCLEAEAVVSACCLKTHQFGGNFTMSLKNTVGMVGKTISGNPTIFMEELHNSRHMRKMIAEINTAYTPALIILDGVEAFTAGGPMTGRLVASEVVLAGTDRIAVDAVGVALLRYYHTTHQVASGPLFQQEQIARAVELGLGVDSPYKIKLVTDDADSAAYAEEIKEVLLKS